MALGVQYDLRNAMHDHLQALDFDNLDRMPTGQLVARANSDSTLVQGLLSFFPIMSGNVLLMLFSLGVMIYLSPLLAVVSLVVAPSLLVVSYRMRWRIFPATWDGQQREGDVVQIVDEDVNGVRVVKAFGQEHRELERVADASKVLYGSQMRAVRLQSRYQPLLEAIPTLGQVAILAFGGWLALHHEITLGTFLAFSTYVVPAGGAGPPAGRRPDHRPAGPGRDRADLPAARPGPGHRRSPPTPSSCRPCEATITFSDVHFPYGEGELKAGSRSWPGSTSIWPRASGWPSSVRAGAASRPWPCWSPASTTPTGDGTRRRPRRAERSPWPRCAARSASCSRRASSSPTRCGPTSPTAGPTPPTRRSRRRPGRLRPTSSSRSCPAATTRWSASAA